MNGGSRRVLVVEDDPIIRMLIVATLQEAGLDVLEAASGQEALSLMEADSVDLLLTDLNMPDPDGAEVAVRARAHDPHVPVLFVTGRPDLLAVRSPPHPYRHLAKPFRMAEMSDTVEEMLNQP